MKKVRNSGAWVLLALPILLGASGKSCNPTEKKDPKYDQTRAWFKEAATPTRMSEISLGDQWVCDTAFGFDHPLLDQNQFKFSQAEGVVLNLGKGSVKGFVLSPQGLVGSPDGSIKAGIFGLAPELVYLRLSAQGDLIAEVTTSKVRGEVSVANPDQYVEGYILCPQAQKISDKKVTDQDRLDATGEIRIVSQAEIDGLKRKDYTIDPVVLAIRQVMSESRSARTMDSPELKLGKTWDCFTFSVGFKPGSKYHASVKPGSWKFKAIHEQGSNILDNQGTWDIKKLEISEVGITGKNDQGFLGVLKFGPSGAMVGEFASEIPNPYELESLIPELGNPGSYTICSALGS